MNFAILSPFRPFFHLTCLVGSVTALEQARGLEIQFDYSRDTSGFFAAGTEARRVLESAATFFELALTDDLGALAPISPNLLTVDFRDPVTQRMVEITPPPIPANTVRIYVGAGDLVGSFIGSGWHGGIYPYGTDGWLDYVDTRGQIGIVYGPGANEVAPWGGSISVDVLDEAGSPRQWDYSLGVLPSGSGLHFYSLMIHELGHVLGFGICDSWTGRIDGNGRFTGARAVEVNGGLVRLDPTRTHWEQGIQSLVYGTDEGQKAAMDPVLIEESPSFPTVLDMAGFTDIGWSVAPALPAPAIPELTAGTVPGSTGLLLNWLGSSDFKYTVLTSKDFSRWSALGETMPGTSGTMQVAFPPDGEVAAYRLLVEHQPAVTIAPAMALRRELEDKEFPAQELAARRRPGGGGMRAGGGSDAGNPTHHWCAGCAGARPLRERRDAMRNGNQ